MCLLLILLCLWTCGQRVSVVHRSTGLDRAVAPDGHWGAVAEPLMKTMLVVEGEIFADPGFRLAAVGVALEIDVLILQRAPDASMKTLSIQRPRPSIEMRTPASMSAPVKAAAVNWLP